MLYEVITVGVSVIGWDIISPAIQSAVLSADNSYIDITFSEGVYTANDGTTALTVADLALTFTKNSGNATGVVISSVKKNDNTAENSATALTGGETTIRVFLAVTGTPNGQETIEVKPQNASSIYDRAGNAMADTQTTGTKNLKDNIAPTISSATRDSDTQITVTLSYNFV